MDVNLFGKITAEMVKNGTINAEDKEIYEYGLKQIAVVCLNIATTVLIGFIFGMVWQSILFMVSYIPLRSYVGGYHARTPFRCYIFSIILIISVLLAVKYVPYNNILLLSLTSISGMLIFIFAPIGDENKPLDEMETKLFRNRTRIILIAEVILICLMVILNLNFIAVCLVSSVVFANCMLMISLLVKGKGSA